MNINELTLTAQAMTTAGKGLLAMDESNPTCNKRFAAHGIAQTEAMRRAYRDLIVGAPGLNRSIAAAQGQSQILCGNRGGRACHTRQMA